MRVLITGATGFIGSALLNTLGADPTWDVRGALRRFSSQQPASANLVAVGDLSADTDWRSALTGVDAIVHTAARVHVMNDRAIDQLSRFRLVNVGATMNLARQAVSMGVRRFLFLSSIKVNGESTQLGHPFVADDPPNPVEPYALSKHEAECKLHQLAEDSGLEVVIIRPVLVYGPGVGANFLSMMRLLDKRIPLPFGGIHNKRSFVALDNLIDLIKASLQHRSAPNQTFLVSDGRDLSTPELLDILGRGLGKPVRLIRVPPFVVRSVAAIAGKGEVAQRLFGSLQVDIDKTRNLLGWNPPLSTEEGLINTAQYFIETRLAR